MRFNTQTQTKLLVEGNEIQVDKFVYLGTIISTEDSTQKDIIKPQTFKSKNSISQAPKYLAMQTVQQKNQSKTMQQQCKISFTLRL
jgi:hypothetical protein